MSKETVTMTEHLLKKRFKVIALWPNTAFKVGEIIDYARGEAVSFYSKYPHLFKELQWWEERKPEEMPEYVKEGKLVLKVKYKQAHDGMIYRSTIGNTWHNVREFSNLTKPATEAEYLIYKNSQTV